MRAQRADVESLASGNALLCRDRLLSGRHRSQRRDGPAQVGKKAQANASSVSKDVERIEGTREEAPRPEILADLRSGARNEDDCCDHSRWSTGQETKRRNSGGRMPGANDDVQPGRKGEVSGVIGEQTCAMTRHNEGGVQEPDGE